MNDHDTREPRSVPLLALESVTKRFGAIEAVIDLDLVVHRHEVVALVGANGLLGVQQPQPFGCLRLCAYSSTVCGALALRSLVAMAARWLPDMVDKRGALRITRTLSPPHQGQPQGWSRSAIGRSWVKSPQVAQSYS